MESKSLIRFCEVLSVKDDNAGLRIKVRLSPEDTMTKYPTTEDLPYCFPLLPKHIHINPKVGECVMVLLSSIDQTESNRFFIGPLISQPYFLEYDTYWYQSRSLLKGGNSAKPLPDPKMNPENNGSLPDRDDVAIQGRGNADLILKENEVRLRCGAKRNTKAIPKDTLLFNREDLGYIQMRYKKMKDNKKQEFSSCINLVADRINLLSHDSKNSFVLNDAKELITDDELIRILSKAHPLPYGDELIDFLKLLVNVLATHTHSFPMDPPKFTQPQLDNVINKKDWESMLSKAIRIN